MSVDVRAHVRACDLCARNKTQRVKKYAPLQTYVVGAPMERIAIDVLGPFPESSSGNKKILVVGDYFSKWMEAYPMPNEEAATVAKVLLDNFLSRFGMPLECHSDLGRNFVSNVFQEVCRLLGVNKTYTTPRHPQSDGLVERFNQCIVSYIRTYMDPRENQSDWDKNLSLVTFAYRSSVHPSTGETPNMLMLGRDLIYPLDVAVASESPDKSKETDYVTDLRERLHEAHEHARTNLQTTARRQKIRYDRFAAKHGFDVGSFVWLKDERRRKGYSPKLQLSYEGPYLIISKLTDVVYRIQRSPRAKPKIVHYEKLKAYQGKDITSWLDQVKLLPVDQRLQIGKPSDGVLPTVKDEDSKSDVVTSKSFDTVKRDSETKTGEGTGQFTKSKPVVDPAPVAAEPVEVFGESEAPDIADVVSDSNSHDDSVGESQKTTEQTRYPRRQRKSPKYYGYSAKLSYVLI